MMQIVLIGFGAGATSALLAVASGSPLAALISIFAQLPILIAAIGWTHLAGLAALLIGTAGVTLILGGASGFLFLVTVGLPAWWIGYLVLLARPADESGALEWYPVGRIVTWTAITAAAAIAVWLLRYGADMAGVRKALAREIDLYLRLLAAVRGRVSDPERTKETLLLIAPGIKAMAFTLFSLINVWLASLIVKVSGRLRRPWPPIAQMTFPPLAPAALAGSVAASFLPELLGLLGSVLAASLVFVYALLGFAVMHVITLGAPARGLMLTGLYCTAVVFSWPLLFLMSVLGLAETLFMLRARVAARRPPPPPGSTNFP